MTEGKEWKKLRRAVDDFAAAMKERLEDKLDEGYTGWADTWPVDKLEKEIEQDIYRLCNGEPQEIDIACRAMFLWYRRQEK